MISALLCVYSVVSPQMKGPRADSEDEVVGEGLEMVFSARSQVSGCW
jgi:hypothetical protein